jgi:hypothetical protein
MQYNEANESENACISDEKGKVRSIDFSLINEFNSYLKLKGSCLSSNDTHSMEVAQ